VPWWVVIIWIKETDSASMRRIQLATAEHAGLSMVVRDMAFVRAPSPANLRLILRAHAGNYDVEVFKARGLLCSIAVQLIGEGIAAIAANYVSLLTG
jgi:hypothetical protein